MRLKALDQGRFSDEWRENYPLIEKIFSDSQLEKIIVDEKCALFRQGIKVRDLILVYSGKISIRYMAANGRHFHLGTMDCDEQIFGEMEFFTNYPCQFDIIAEEALTISIISASRLKNALLENPQLALFFASAIAFDYQDTLDIFLRRMLYSIAYNIAYDLYQQHLNLLPVNHFEKNYLEAERFGTTDRVYRRAVKELMALGIVERNEHSLKIKDLTALRRFIDCA